MRILVVTNSHFKEYGGPYTAISQKVEYLNKKNIKNKLIYRSTNNYKYNLDLKAIIEDYDIVHIYGIWRPFLVKVFLVAKLLKKKNCYIPVRCHGTMGIKSKKIEKINSLEFISKKNIE